MSEKRDLLSKWGEIWFATLVKVCQALVFPGGVAAKMTLTVHVPMMNLSKLPRPVAAILLIIQMARNPVEPV